MSKEPRESSRHRQPHRRDSLTSVLSWAGLQPRSSPTKTSTTSSSSDSSPPSPSHHGLSRGRRHSSSPDDKKKARRRSMALRRFSISVPGAGAVDEDSLNKTKLKKTPSWTLDHKASESSSRTTTKAASTDAVNKTTASASTISDQGTAEAKEKASNGDYSEEKASKEGSQGPTQQLPLPPPPKPKSILRVASPDGRKPPPRKIPCFSTTLPEFDPRKPTADHACLVPLPESSVTSVTGSLSSSQSSICRPEKHGTGATVRFATATVHRVEVGPGRRFLPVRRRSKSTITYISRFDDENSLKKNLTSPTKQRRHRANQAAMGRYWQRTEEEEAREREEARQRAEQEAEQYRAEPSSPPDPDLISKDGNTTPSSLESADTNDKLEEIYVDDEKPESDSPRRAKRDASPASYRSSSLNLALPAPEPDTGFPSDDFSLEEELEAQQENYKTGPVHIDIKIEAADAGDWPLAERGSEQSHQEVTTLLEIRTPRGIILSPIAEEFAIDDEEEEEESESDSDSDSESANDSDNEPLETTMTTDAYQEPEEEHTPTMPPTPPRQSTALLLSEEDQQTTIQEDSTDGTPPSNLLSPDQPTSENQNWSSPRLRPAVSSKRHHTHAHAHGKHGVPSPPASPPLMPTKPATATAKRQPSPKIPAFAIPIMIPKITIGERTDDNQGHHKRSSSWGHRRSFSSSSSSSSSDKRSGSPMAKGSSSDRESSPGGKLNRLHLSGRRRKSSGSRSESHHGHGHAHGGHKTSTSIAV
ncbi:hypothetical protein SMACR_05594 [Sordaria macrospora]|uniref:WGS project CABT00000000 data, contig 2.26 n=2 Tax=Sordaria macrospora TaxID=5147 RepID=F7W463_SORMK|nr:uncharacterized protein SMAC_05594 [Sordaria macrospora k-hell]KAA8628634.1 hypothetical protein SMACR_05594 [Sordaria macrospora]KAH7633867.1 hypothetical protein B0T09DRAFT_99601 [Sordaria sp. MPI-SDFR-AT-0083]WPJ59773.1 hypothetical protein SMAC4_05594 [Sordaria macrospora]CCC12417.1 unnamed protein product [Sordaria macrospora k-hell]